MSSSTIPVVLTTDTTNLLMIIVGNTTAQVAMIYDTNSSDIVTDCIPVREITMPTSGKLLEEQITFNHTNGTIQVCRYRHYINTNGTIQVYRYRHYRWALQRMFFMVLNNWFLIH